MTKRFCFTCFVFSPVVGEKVYRRASIKAFEALARRKFSADGTVYGGSQGTPPLASTEDVHALGNTDK